MGANFFFHFNIKDITSQISPGSWRKAEEKKYVSGHLFPPTSSWVGFALPTCSCPGEHRAQSSWEALGFLSVVPIPTGWLWLGVCGKQKEKGLEFMRRKVNLLTCEAVVSTYSGQMLVPEAKYPSSRTDFLLYFESHLPFPHPNSSKQDTEKQRKYTASIDLILVAHGSFSSRAANYPGWASNNPQHLGIKPYQGLTQKAHAAEMEEVHYGISVNIPHVSLSNKFFSTESWV